MALNSLVDVPARSRDRLLALQEARAAAELIDRGRSAPQIATELGIPVDRAKRLVDRRSLLSTDVTPEELILLRAAGDLSTAELMDRLHAVVYTDATPSEGAWTDGVAGRVGTAQQLEHAYQDRLLTVEEYAELRESVRVEPAAS